MATIYMAVSGRNGGSQQLDQNAFTLFCCGEVVAVLLGMASWKTITGRSAGITGGLLLAVGIVLSFI